MTCLSPNDAERHLHKLTRNRIKLFAQIMKQHIYWTQLQYLARQGDFIHIYNYIQLHAPNQSEDTYNNNAKEPKHVR